MNKNFSKKSISIIVTILILPIVGLITNIILPESTDKTFIGGLILPVVFWSVFFGVFKVLGQFIDD